MAIGQQTMPLADRRYLCKFSTLHRQGVNIDLRLGLLASAEPPRDATTLASQQLSLSCYPSTHTSHFPHRRKRFNEGLTSMFLN